MFNDKLISIRPTYAAFFGRTSRKGCWKVKNM